ncbi:Aste57867_13465 [Aphanomyces stellatus]|uniref:Aste57867_13465 protein n=1 Tax=Aphanomyces stellatus TaxID=120398 RepID=A0A485KYI2_9STRA|nr:hypothetical protein As57867_013415 [Aphanomyces stellatus]VFT90303.1 Aste57867_13465 [Aphanomyces stellatus]
MSKGGEKEPEERTDVEEEEEEDEVAVVEEDKSKAEEASAMNKMQGDDGDDGEKEMDVNTMRQLLATLKADEEAEKDALAKREKELAAIKVSKEDIALVASEMLLAPAVADRKLRDAGGDVHACLHAMLRLP